MTDLETRLVELELRYTEQQHLLEELSGVVATQQRTIDIMEAQLRLMRTKLEAEPGVTDAGPAEKPPHY